MESQPQNPKFRINPENFHPCYTGLHTAAVTLSFPVVIMTDSKFSQSVIGVSQYREYLNYILSFYRSSYSCCYFVLPCCHHDFDSKFSQSVVGGSQYREYLNYIQLVGENCGFTVEEDMLRIPSTKRVSFLNRPVF